MSEVGQNLRIAGRRRRHHRLVLGNPGVAVAILYEWVVQLADHGGVLLEDFYSDLLFGAAT